MQGTETLKPYKGTGGQPVAHTLLVIMKLTKLQLDSYSNSSAITIINMGDLYVTYYSILVIMVQF